MKSFFGCSTAKACGRRIPSFFVLLIVLGATVFGGNLRSDLQIVRTILESNHVLAPVSAVATIKNGRVVALHFNEPYKQPWQNKFSPAAGVRISKLPAVINGLDALDTLDVSYAVTGATLSLPADLSGLSGLRKLSITGTLLGSIPGGFSGLQGLRSLILAEDGLQSFPDAITSLPFLVELDLSSNEIESIPNSIGSLHNLRSLDIRGQQTDSVFSISSELARDSLLSILDISGNKLAAFPSAVLHLNNLTELHIENCQLSVLPTEIGSLERLVFLDAGWNGLSGLPSGMSGLRALKTLLLVANPFDSFPAVICSVPSLTYLNVQECHLSRLPPDIGKLSLLDELNLCYNQISSLPSEIRNLKKVTTLRLHNNNLSSLPDAIAELTPRKWLSLKNNPVYNPSRVNTTISKWLCDYDENWRSDFSVCDRQTEVTARGAYKKILPVFAVSGGRAHYTLFSSSYVSLKLYDMQGRLLKVLSDSKRERGSYTVAVPSAFSKQLCALSLKVGGTEITRAFSTVK
jgi:Leucine-rich repeat (LRR) protein